MRETVDRPPHREIDRQRESDDLPAFLIEERNSLGNESEQAEHRDEAAELDRPRDSASAVNRERYKRDHRDRQRIEVHQVRVPRHEVMFREKPRKHEREPGHARDEERRLRRPGGSRGACARSASA